MRNLRSTLFACVMVGSVFATGACGDDVDQQGTPDGAPDASTPDAPLGPLFTDNPECVGDPVTAFAGTQPQVIKMIQIGAKEDGFDLDGNRDPDCTPDETAADACHKPDNKLSAASIPAMEPLNKSLAGYDLMIPLEMFDYTSTGNDECVKFAIYLGKFAGDHDNDGQRPAVEGGDCNDNSADIGPNKPELPGNFIDDNCNGIADEAGTMPSGDMLDHDDDGTSIAAGDCDDTNATVFPGNPEICGDGLDNDCDGVADRTGGHDGMPSTACNPFDAATPQDIPIDAVSLDATTGKPAIIFDDGKITEAGGVRTLHAGPSIFALTVPFSDNIGLELKISGATIEATVSETNGRLSFSHGRLGGVIDSKTADTIRGLEVTQIGLTPENSLLDAAYAGILGTILSLPRANPTIQAKYPDCRTPDIDVDGDGLEAFCETDQERDPRYVDICIDGDGTEIADVKDSNGVVTMQCAAAQNAGKDRFVDGISIELNFETTPAKSLVPPPGPQ